MKVTIPLVLIAAAIALVSLRYAGLRLWQLLVCLILGFLLAGTAFAPEIQHILSTLLGLGNK